MAINVNGKRGQVETVSMMSHEAKRQRLEQVSTVAHDRIQELLAGDLQYPVSDDEWSLLVEMTQKHEKFDKFFSFPTSQTDAKWKEASTKKRATTLKIVAIDCEMCVTRSLAPTGEEVKNSSALVRVTAIDGEQILGKVVTDLIVHQPEPGADMVDPKTKIHGITLEMIDHSKISVEKARKHLLKYVNADTIIVGHSVYGDLASLRLNHRRVIDTSMVFQRQGDDPKRRTPGLKDLTKVLLGFEMPDGHDSAIDAQASMLAAKYAVKNPCGSVIPALNSPNSTPVRVLDPVQQQDAEMKQYSFARNSTIASLSSISRSCRLLVHRLVRGVDAADIQNFFVNKTRIVPVAVEQIAWKQGQNRGSTNVTFETPEHCALAFKTIRRKATKDAIGRAQKSIKITTASGKVFNNIQVALS